MTLTDLSALPEESRNELIFWKQMLSPLLALERGVTKAIADLSKSSGIPDSTMLRKFYALKKGQTERLIDRRALGPNAWQTRRAIGLSEQDRELLKTYVERNQRCNETAVDKLRSDWRKGLVTSTAPLDPRTGYPVGWSKRNLLRKENLPTSFELKAVRIGRSAASSERRLVYTTRAGLWVGSHYLFDDMWHDHFVNHLDQRKSGRPLEFHALDLYSACKFAWGMRVRTENELTGRMEQLKEADMRFLLAHVLGSFGYSERGTELVVERGTAAIREDLEELLWRETDGLVRVARGGMDGAPAHAGQYAGRAKGNFRFKAALETLGNLIHNEMAFLPGQTGRDIDHRPEQLHGLLKNNDALLAAVSQLPPERIEMLSWELLTIQQFRVIAEEIYSRINSRTEHDLEGWDMHYVPDRRSGLMRRLAPAEVFQPGSRRLRRLSPQAVAMILGIDSSVPCTIRRGKIELTDGEISGDVLRFEASTLPEGERYDSVLNPFTPSTLWLFDAKGRYVAACPRIDKPCRSDIEAVQRQMGEASRIEARLLAPLRARHLQEARDKLARHQHNSAVVSGSPVTPEEKVAARRDARQESAAARFGRLVESPEPSDSPTPQPPTIEESW